MNQIPVQKLILLFIARKEPGIRRSRLRDAALATLAMDYLDAARALDELAESDLLTMAARPGQPILDAEDRTVLHCELTEKGLAALEALENQIPVSTRRFLETYLDGTRTSRTAADLITAVIEDLPEGGCRLTCRQTDGDRTDFSLSLLLPSEDLARRAAARWRENPAGVYAALLASLLAEQQKKTPED